MNVTDRPAFHLVSLILMLLAGMDIALAQQALVRAYDNKAQPLGQAYMAYYGERCIALLPTHVAAETTIPALLLEGSALLGEAESINDLGDDLSIARVTGSAAQRCGYSLSTVSRAIDKLLRERGLATLRSVNGDGTLGRMAVAIVDDDGSKYLRVRPTSDRIQIRKGHSGSLLMIGERPVGMLLSVDTRHGVGKVLRLDDMLSRAESYLAAAAAPAMKATDAGAAAAKQADLAAASSGGIVSGWNTLPLDAEHRAVNLVAAGDAPAWRAQVEAWPVEVELDLAGDKVVINRIELDGNGVADTGGLPNKVELLVNNSSDQRRWRSLLNREADFDVGGVAVFSFAPTWARQVMVRIWDNRAGTGTLSLRRIRVSGP